MKVALLVFNLLISFYANAQLGAPLRKNALVIEYSYAGMYSDRSLTVSYERIVKQKGNINYYVTVRGGKWATLWGSDSLFENGPKINLGFGAFLGKRSHHLEVQSGLEVYFINQFYANGQYSHRPDEFHAYALAGYRFQQPGKPLMFRLSVASYGLISVAVGVTIGRVK